MIGGDGVVQQQNPHHVHTRRQQRTMLLLGGAAPRSGRKVVSRDSQGTDQRILPGIAEQVPRDELDAEGTAIGDNLLRRCRLIELSATPRSAEAMDKKITSRCGEAMECTPSRYPRQCVQ